jgi:hypothetical protein
MRKHDKPLKSAIAASGDIGGSPLRVNETNDSPSTCAEITPRRDSMSILINDRATVAFLRS